MARELSPRRGKFNQTYRSGSKLTQHVSACFLGTCKYGNTCPYIHDPNQVAVCPRFLSSGTCPDGDVCDLSHELTPHRVPACHHFARGNCSNDACRYAHIRVNPAAPVCRPFATLGYCPQGQDCPNKHVHECPDFDKNGTCTDSKCKLPHIERAGKMRAAAAAAAVTAPAQQSSASNQGNVSTNTIVINSDDEEDEDDSLDSDVDSDTLSEYAFGQSTGEDGDVRMQHDFIGF